MFASYRMLVGFIFAFAVLAIILGAVNYFDRINISNSIDRIYKGVDNATSSPNEDSVVETDLLLDPITFSSRSFENATGIPAECFRLQARAGTASFEFSDTHIEVKTRVATDMYAKCETVDTLECEISCIVSFGKPAD